MTNEDPEIIYSPLCRTPRRNQTSVKVYIYRSEIEAECALEVVDIKGTSTVWTETFQSDADALEEVMSLLKNEGIGVFTNEERGRFH